MKPTIPELINKICERQNADVQAMPDVTQDKTDGRIMAYDECVAMLGKCENFKQTYYTMCCIKRRLRELQMELAFAHKTHDKKSIMQNSGKMDVYRDMVDVLHKNLNAYARGRPCPAME